MAYADILATEARGMYSPPNGNSPQMIPDYWRPSPGEEPRTDLPELSDAELNALGWKGPIADVPYDFYTQDKNWNTETREWEVTELNQFNKEKRVDYRKFWNYLIDTNAYAQIKLLAKQSLEVNTIATEFIVLLSDAKNGNANVSKIQEAFIDIFNSIPFTAEELTEIQTAFNEGGLYSVYTLS